MTDATVMGAAAAELAVTKVETDIVVVGAGFGGLAAALRAQELGAHVVILERSVEGPGWNNSRMAGGRFHLSFLEPDVEPAVLERKMLAETQGYASKEVIHALAANYRRTFEWTRAQGARYVQINRGALLVPVRPNRRGNIWKGRGPDLTLRTFYEAFKRGNGQFIPRSRARELTMRDGQASGIVALSGRKRLDIAARAVVFADGGFQGNPDLLRDYAGVTKFDSVLQRGASTGIGDCLLMAVEVGAKLANCQALYGHLLHKDAQTNPALSPYPMLDQLASGGVVVAGDGRRFYDESKGGVHAVNQLVRLSVPGTIWLVFDGNAWQTSGRLNQIVPPNPNLVQAKARLVRANDIESLATRMGVPSAQLAQTITDFNAAMATANGLGLTPPRSMNTRALSPPFYAVPLIAGITQTLGGPVIDGAARVLSESGSPIPRLYAAGGAAAGASGGPTPAYEGGIAVAFALGLIAAETAHGDLLPT